MKFVQDMGGSAVGALYNDSINVFIQLRRERRGEVVGRGANTNRYELKHVKGM